MNAKSACESPRERRSLRESDNGWTGEDRWEDNGCCCNCRCARGHRARVHYRALSHLEACEKNRGSMCCHALCGCGYGTWMLQDDRTASISQKRLLQEKCGVKPRGRESKSILNRNSYTAVFLTSSWITHVIRTAKMRNFRIQWLVIIPPRVRYTYKPTSKITYTTVSDQTNSVSCRNQSCIFQSWCHIQSAVLLNFC